MAEIILQDNWKKECRTWVAILIFVCVIGVAVPLGFYFRPMSDNPTMDCVKTSILFGVIACFALYGVLYSALYKLTVTGEKIIRKSLFGTKEIAIRGIGNYDFKRYSKISGLFEFKILINNKAFKIYTHFPDKFREILESNNTN